MRQNTDLDIEKLEVLDGSRNRDKSRAAVRIADLTGILEVPLNLQSKTAGAAPTQAEYNKLVGDVAMLHRLLLQVARRLRDNMAPTIP